MVNSCNTMATAGAFKVTMTPRARSYRLVHTSGSHENSPEMLGTAKSESEGFRSYGLGGEK